jgi:hypothetical protein
MVIQVICVQPGIPKLVSVLLTDSHSGKTTHILDWDRRSFFKFSNLLTQSFFIKRESEQVYYYLDNSELLGFSLSLSKFCDVFQVES